MTKEERITQKIIFEHLKREDRFAYGKDIGKPRCSKSVSGSTFRGHRCHKVATYMEPDSWADEGDPLRPFCKVHAPSQVKARQAKKDDERDAVLKARRDHVAARKADFVLQIIEAAQIRGSDDRRDAVAALVTQIFNAGKSSAMRRW